MPDAAISSCHAMLLIAADAFSPRYAMPVRYDAACWLYFAIFLHFCRHLRATNARDAAAPYDAYYFDERGARHALRRLRHAPLYMFFHCRLFRHHFPLPPRCRAAFSQILHYIDIASFRHAATPFLLMPLAMLLLSLFCCRHCRLRHLRFSAAARLAFFASPLFFRCCCCRFRFSPLRHATPTMMPPLIFAMLHFRFSPLSPAFSPLML